LLVGDTYYRALERNGEPLSGEDLAREQKRLKDETKRRLRERKRGKRTLKKQDRYELRLTLVPKLHQAELVGEEQHNGRDTYVIASKPNQEIRPRDDFERIVAANNLKLWIDKETWHPVRIEAIQFRRVPKRPEVRKVWADFIQVEGVWLVDILKAETEVRRNRDGMLQVKSTQDYFDYRRFQSEANITFHPDQPVTVDQLPPPKDEGN
jgi:hypothetical protein